MVNKVSRGRKEFGGGWRSESSNGEDETTLTQEIYRRIEMELSRDMYNRVRREVRVSFSS